jgi:hypothetical protein
MMISGAAVVWAGARLIDRSRYAGAGARSQARAKALQSSTWRYGLGFVISGAALAALGALTLADVSPDGRTAPFTTNTLDLVARW